MTFLQGGRRAVAHAPTPTHTRIQPINPVSLHPNDVFSSRWTTPDISIWTRVAKDPQPFNLYMFRGNNPISKVHHIKEYVTGGLFQQLQILLRWPHTGQEVHPWEQQGLVTWLEGSSTNALSSWRSSPPKSSPTLHSVTPLDLL